MSDSLKQQRLVDAVAELQAAAVSAGIAERSRFDVQIYDTSEGPLLFDMATAKAEVARLQAAIDQYRATAATR